MATSSNSSSALVPYRKAVKTYAVKVGWNRGLYADFQHVRNQIENFSGCQQQSFANENLARTWLIDVDSWVDYRNGPQPSTPFRGPSREAFAKAVAISGLGGTVRNRSKNKARRSPAPPPPVTAPGPVPAPAPAPAGDSNRRSPAHAPRQPPNPKDEAPARRPLDNHLLHQLHPYPLPDSRQSTWQTGYTEKHQEVRGYIATVRYELHRDFKDDDADE